MGEAATGAADKARPRPDDGPPSAAEGLRRRARWGPWVAAGLVLVPLLVACAAELGAAAGRPASTGEVALLELHAQHAVRGEHLLGPATAGGWNQPGPLYFYLLAPGYLLTGGATTSLYLGAVLLNALAVLGLLAVHFRGEPRSLGRLGAAALVSAFLATFAAAHAPSALSTPASTVAVVLPFGALVVLCAAVGAGRVTLAPVMMLVHALLVQTELACAPAATAMVLVGIGLLARHRRHAGPEPPGRRAATHWLLAAGAVVAIAWLPPLGSEWAGGWPNSAAIVAALGGGAPPLDWVPAIRLACHGLALPVLHAAGLVAPGALQRNVAVAVALAQLGLLALAYVRARRERRRYLAALALVGAIGTLAAAWTCRYLAVLGGQQPGLAAWLALLGVINWMAILSAFLSGLVPPAPAGRRRAPWHEVGVAAWFLVLAGFLSFSGAAAVLASYDRARESPPSDATAATAVVAQIQTLLQLAGGRSAWLRLEQRDAWPVLAGALLQLEALGIAPVLERRHRSIFGGGFDYRDLGPAEPGGLSLSLAPRHDRPLVARYGTTFVYGSPATPGFAKLPSRPILRAVGVGGTADVPRCVDGVVPADGTALGTDLATLLPHAGAAIVLSLQDVLVDRVVMSASGDDSFRVDGSRDGEQFEPLGLIPATATAELRVGELRLLDRGPWRALRVTPESGAPPYEVAEIVPNVVGWGLRPTGGAGLEGDVRVAVDGMAPADGSPWDAPGALEIAPEGYLVLRLPAVPLSEGRPIGVRLSADCNDEYLVEGSRDGVDFDVIGVATPRHGWGLQTDFVYFNEPVIPGHVRISPRAGDGSYAISEVGLLVADGLLLDVGTPAARNLLKRGWSTDESAGAQSWAWAIATQASCEVPLRPAVPYELFLAVAPPAQARDEQWLEVHLNDTRLERRRLPPGESVQHVLLPATAVQATNTVDFAMAYAVAPTAQERRSLAVRFDWMLFQPLDGVAQTVAPGR